MKKVMKIGGGLFCLGFGGLWCLGLFISRVDPPEVGRANMAAVIAAGIVAFGVNLLGKAIFAGSRNEEKMKNIVLGLAFAAWLGISIGLAAWHQMILHIRKTRAEEAIQRMKQEKLEPPYSEPAARSPQG